jgi:hypothetical protein
MPICLFFAFTNKVKVQWGGNTDLRLYISGLYPEKTSGLDGIRYGGLQLVTRI